MVEQQQKLILSPYMYIYELIIPNDNLLRQIKELVDFEFIYDELIDKYCLDISIIRLKKQSMGNPMSAQKVMISWI